MWFMFQGLIVILVVFSDIRWHWARPHDGSQDTAIGIIAVFAALVATIVLSRILSCLSRSRRREYETERESLSLGRPAWHSGDLLQDWRRIRISHDPR